MHKPYQRSLFEMLNRMPRGKREHKLVPAQQVVVFQPTCGACNHTITPAEYDSDFCPWCGNYGASLPF